MNSTDQRNHIPSIGMIVADLDNTLMHTDKSISDYTANIFARCREAGIKTAFVTARSEMASARAANIVKPEMLITCGGALARRGSEIFYTAPLSKDVAFEVVGLCLKLPSTGRILAEMSDGKYLVNYETRPGAVGDYAHAESYDFTRPFECDAFKLVINIADDEDRERLKNSFPDLSIHAYSDSRYCFIADAAATKMNAIKAVSKAISVDLANVAAFGDDNNDIDMLQKCGAGVAVENAIPEAKDAAGYICADCNDDGPAHWIEENLL